MNKKDQSSKKQRKKCLMKCEITGKEKPSISFHRFPKYDDSLRDIWLKACKREKFRSAKTLFLCSKHFKNEFIDRRDGVKPYLRKNAVPTIFNNKRDRTADILLRQHKETVFAKPSTEVADKEKEVIYQHNEKVVDLKIEAVYSLANYELEVAEVENDSEATEDQYEEYDDMVE